LEKEDSDALVGFAARHPGITGTDENEASQQKDRPA
jgi:hypothetical protein